jgi:predicted GNAT superfamily acetyltransferase
LEQAWSTETTQQELKKVDISVRERPGIALSAYLCSKVLGLAVSLFQIVAFPQRKSAL